MANHNHSTISSRRGFLQMLSTLGAGATQYLAYQAAWGDWEGGVVLQSGAYATLTPAESDLIAAMPRRFVAMHASRFGVVAREAPLRLRKFSIRAVVLKAALMDAGLAWLDEELRAAVAA